MCVCFLFYSTLIIPGFPDRADVAERQQRRNSIHRRAVITRSLMARTISTKNSRNNDNNDDSNNMLFIAEYK